MAFAPVPLNPPDEKQAVRRHAQAINDLGNGRSNAFGSVTLTVSTTTTTVTDRRAGIDSVIVLMPNTANAAGAVGTTYVSSRVIGAFTLTHANNAQTDRTFAYAIVG